MCIRDRESLTPPVLKKPDFLVSTRSFSVENGGFHRSGSLGHSEEYFWEHELQNKYEEPQNLAEEA